MLGVTHPRPQPDDSFFAPLREHPLTVIALCVWALFLALLAWWGAGDEELFALMPLAF